MLDWGTGQRRYKRMYWGTGGLGGLDKGDINACTGGLGGLGDLGTWGLGDLGTFGVTDTSAPRLPISLSSRLPLSSSPPLLVYMRTSTCVYIAFVCRLPTPRLPTPYSLLHADTRMSFVTPYSSSPYFLLPTPYSLLSTTCGHTNVLCYSLLPTPYSLLPTPYHPIFSIAIAIARLDYPTVL